MEVPARQSEAPTSPSRSTQPSSSGCASPSTRLSTTADKFRPPEPLSLNSTLRAHSRTRLYVNPLYWTSQHLLLLDCRFVREKAILQTETKTQSADAQVSKLDQSSPEERRAQEFSSANISSAARRLRHSRASWVKTEVVQQILELYGLYHDCFRPHSLKLSFQFNKQHAAFVRTDGIFSTAPSKTAVLDIAYLDLTLVASRRRRSIYGPPSSSRRRFNLLVNRLLEKKHRRVKPENKLKDPFIVATLIALAQDQRYKRNLNRTAPELEDPTSSESSTKPIQDTENPDPESTTFFEVHLLALPTIDAPHLYHYTARFSAAFLDRFDQPSRYFPSDQAHIHISRIPLAPTKEFVRSMSRAVDNIKRAGARLDSGVD
ncbi:hypothetical protein B0T19DRAFT_438551 [Cercophora scortea]|uniref:Uncharacterized protein n=1 Tax=Cercophora scortea TaxID=314031 RepID=A0AAE0IUU5_9PEZI|nr:hypothetical protein B0T19DRAFT_438551 [Cercophora scortea]